jgi:hypothetical protein
VPEREGEAWLDCTATMCDGSAGRGDLSMQLTGSFPLVGHERHSLWSRPALACARPAAPVKAGHLAAPRCGVALTGAARGALRSDAALVASAAWAEGGRFHGSNPIYSITMMLLRRNG